MYGTQVRTLVQEDLTCRRAMKPTDWNYWPHVQLLLKPTCPKAHAPQENPLQCDASTASKVQPHSLKLEKAHMQQQRPSAADNKISKNNLKKNLAINLKHTFHHTTLQIHSSHKYQLLLYHMPGKVLGANRPRILLFLFLFSSLISSHPTFRLVSVYLICCKKSHT